MAIFTNIKTGERVRSTTNKETGEKTREVLNTPPIKPTATTPVITPTSLEPNTAPVVTPAPTPIAGPKLQADLETQTEDALTQKVAQEKMTAEATKGTALQSYLDQLTKAKGLTTLTSEAYAQDGGVDAITPELNDINDQIRREQLSSRRAQEAVQSAGGGLKAGAASEIANIQRESLAKQADLSIIQMAVQGRYDSAKEIADRAVSAQFEQQQQAIDIAKFDYTENKELFTKAEQREYDLLFSDRERKLEEAKQNKQDMYNLGVQASADGAPSSVVQKMFQAKTREEALAIGGGYIGALDREAKRASIEASRASTASSYDAIAARAEQNKALLGTLNGKSQTEGERLTEVYANRMNEANAVVSKLGSTFAQPKAIFGSLFSAAGAPSLLQSADRQQYEQAQRNFLNAVLRKESGAVISPEEFSSGAKQYFPQAGDSAGVLEQKAQNRNTAISGLYATANVPMPELEAAPVGTPLQTTSGISYTILPNP